MSGNRRSNPADIANTYSLLVLNLTFRTTVDDLNPLFDPYGRVVDIHIPRDRTTGQSRGFAFVRYKYEDEADEAIERLDGMKFDGRYIRVQYAKYGPNAERIQRGRISAHARSRSRSPSRRNRYRDGSRSPSRRNRYRDGSRSPPRLTSYRDRVSDRRGHGRDSHERHQDRDYRRRSRSPLRSRSPSSSRSLSRSRSPRRSRSRSPRYRGVYRSRNSSRSGSNSGTNRISGNRSRSQRSSPPTQRSTTSLSGSQHPVEGSLSVPEWPDCAKASRRSSDSQDQ